MTSSQLILVAVTSALISVFTMLFVATVRRARARDDKEPERLRRAAEQLITAEVPGVRPTRPKETRSAGNASKKTTTKKTTAKKTTAKKTSSKKTPARKAPATRKKR